MNNPAHHEFKLVAPEPIATAPAVNNEASEHDVWRADNPDMVVQCQPALAVYENSFAAIVIRMEARDCDDDDPFVYCRPENLSDLIAALKRYLPTGGSK